MLRYAHLVFKLLTDFRDYKPQSVNPCAVFRWVRQYPLHCWGVLLALLDDVVYFSERETVSALSSLNERILGALAPEGIDITHVVYVSIDSAGSSSHLMLNLLRNTDNLEQQKAVLLDSKDLKGIHEHTRQIERGAVVYVDDFAGTGKQFCRNRNAMADYIVGSFSEFLLAPAICEEADRRIRTLGVEPIMHLLHTVDQRPLHRCCCGLSQARKVKVLDLCKQINRNCARGFGDLATMVVFYSNAPNTMPLVFRGNRGQSPYVGIFPRFDDR